MLSTPYSASEILSYTTELPAEEDKLFWGSTQRALHKTTEMSLFSWKEEEMMRKCSEESSWTARRGLVMKCWDATTGETENSSHAIRELGEISSQNIPTLQKISVISIFSWTSEIDEDK